MSLKSIRRKSPSTRRGSAEKRIKKEVRSPKRKSKRESDRPKRSRSRRRTPARERVRKIEERPKKSRSIKISRSRSRRRSISRGRSERVKKGAAPPEAQAKVEPSGEVPKLPGAIDSTTGIQAFIWETTPLAVNEGVYCSKDHPLTLARGRPDKAICRGCEAFIVQEMMWACTMCKPRVAYCEQCAMKLKAGFKNSVEFLPELSAMLEQKAAATKPRVDDEFIGDKANRRGQLWCTSSQGALSIRLRIV